MNEEEDFKCVVVVNKNSNPELYQELMMLKNTRARSERLRTLSTAFLKMVPFNITVGQTISVAEDINKEDLEHDDRSSLISQVGGSFE
jgi:hypothetical protein